MSESLCPISTAARAGTARATGAMLLMVAGFTAAFGAAACCALPILLGTIGLGSVWLGSLALLAGPYQSHLVTGAGLCLLAGGALLWRRDVVACTLGTECDTPTVPTLTVVALVLGVMLVALGYTFA